MEFPSLSQLSFTLTDLCVYIRNFGMLAPAVAFVIFVIQAIVPIFPYIILASAGGVIFGFFLGFFLSWVGALCGACIAYGICRYCGANWLAQRIEKRLGRSVTDHKLSTAFWSIVIARIIPVVPTPLINLAAAISGVSFWNFFFSSAIGKLPSALLYTSLGLCLVRMQDARLVLTLLGVTILLYLMLKCFAAKKSVDSV
ncbi:MAG: TVP38/TMEM64 family protein [Syntrophomonadaceae bacterium]|jgi:uncharacterized membrane protein YdjX (TVP38/TMEM64 family)